MGGTFIEAILNNLMALMPFVVVRSYQRGVRWRFGRHEKELLPGFHWKVWIVHQVEVCETVDEAIELPIQSVVTSDDIPVAFSVNIGFRVVDVVKHWNGVNDFHESVKALIMTHLAKRVREVSLIQLNGDGVTKLEKSLEGTITTRLKEWGVQCFHCGFTNMVVRPRQIRLFTDGASTPHFVNSNGGHRE